MTNPTLENPPKILLRRRASMGDVIMATAVVEELALAHPGAAIDVITDHVDCFRNNQSVRNLYLSSAPPNPADYDIYINLDDAYELNPCQHYLVSYMQRALGQAWRPSADTGAAMTVSSDDQMLVDQDRATWGMPYIVVHLRQWAWSCKNISIDVWFSVFEKLFTVRDDFKIICVGSGNDYAVQDHDWIIDARSRYNPQQLAYLCEHANCFVGIDSGPMQCAAASETHIIALLTHLKPERILPYRRGEMGWNCTAISTTMDCTGCNDLQVRPVRQVVCQHGTYPCATQWDTAAIAQAILSKLP